LGFEPAGTADAAGDATGVGQLPGCAGLQPPGIPGMEVKVGDGIAVVVSK